MNVVSINPAQLQQIIVLLTEIRDRLPVPPKASPQEPVPAPRVFGWPVDGSDGPPSLVQFLMAHAAMESWKNDPRPRLALEGEAFRALIRAGEAEGYTQPMP